MFLSREEVVALTGRKYGKAQVEALRAMGIEHTVRPDGVVVVLKTHIEKLLGGNAEQAGRRRTEPNWDAIPSRRQTSRDGL